MEKSVLQQAIERVDDYYKLTGNQDISCRAAVQIIASLLPAERAMLEKAMGDSFEAGYKNGFSIADGNGNQYPDKQTFIDNYLK